MFPPSLLAKLFVRGSLMNNVQGFEFKLKNIIDSGTITGLGTLTVGEKLYPPSSLKVRVGANEISGDLITPDKPVYARTAVEIHILVSAEPLSEGEYKVILPIQTREAGRLQISLTEPLAA